MLVNETILQWIHTIVCYVNYSFSIIVKNKFIHDITMMVDNTEYLLAGYDSWERVSRLHKEFPNNKLWQHTFYDLSTGSEIDDHLSKEYFVESGLTWED